MNLFDDGLSASGLEAFGTAYAKIMRLDKRPPVIGHNVSAASYIAAGHLERSGWHRARMVEFALALAVADRRGLTDDEIDVTLGPMPNSTASSTMARLRFHAIVMPLAEMRTTRNGMPAHVNVLPDFRDGRPVCSRLRRPRPAGGVRVGNMSNE